MWPGATDATCLICASIHKITSDLYSRAGVKKKVTSFVHSPFRLRNFILSWKWMTDHLPENEQVRVPTINVEQHGWLPVLLHILPVMLCYSSALRFYLALSYYRQCHADFLATAAVWDLLSSAQPKYKQQQRPFSGFPASGGNRRSIAWQSEGAEWWACDSYHQQFHLPLQNFASVA